MEETALKIDLIEKIEHADSNQLREIYGLVINYFNSNEPSEQWDMLPEPQKKKILKSIEQADAGLGTPVKEAIQRMRAKHGLNG